MGTLHHLSEKNVGAVLTKVALSARIGRNIGWIDRQGNRVSGTHNGTIETWERCFKNGGRLSGYTLLVIEERKATA
jgi:hypothetical protein